MYSEWYTLMALGFNSCRICHKITALKTSKLKTQTPVLTVSTYNVRNEEIKHLS
jgi:nitrate/TMAO reductase-like tetraheme cytochrome c subunit